MEKKISERTVALLKQHRDEIGFVLRFTEEEVYGPKATYLMILNFFTGMEAFLAQNLDEGIDTDTQPCRDVAHAVDEFNLGDEERVDLEDLNVRLTD